jgi:hypothetical protein
MDRVRFTSTTNIGGTSAPESVYAGVYLEGEIGGFPPHVAAKIVAAGKGVIVPPDPPDVKPSVVEGPPADKAQKPKILK